MICIGLDVKTLVGVVVGAYHVFMIGLFAWAYLTSPGPYG